jgi:hypothetical protein
LIPVSRAFQAVPVSYYVPEGSVNGRSMNILMNFKMFNNMAANRK